VRVALAPRFALSCTRELLEGVAEASAREAMLVHTHSSEQRDEVAAVVAETGQRNLAYLAATGLASPRLCVAHAIWLDEHELDLVADHDVKVLHCPSSNFKLGSGTAPVPEMRARGITVSLGADGAACSNRLDMFDEMRLAATMQAVRLGPGALAARDLVWMATRGGSRALGLDGDIGSLEPGKRADLIVVERDRPHLVPDGDPYSTLVYAARGSDVRHVVVDGVPLVSDFALTQLDAGAVTAAARQAARTLLGRAGL
jgi:5-methylthioadenosine/S-adenosylhomocysteine deaminase